MTNTASLIRTALDNAGLSAVQVSQTEEGDPIILTGRVATDHLKAKAEATAKALSSPGAVLSTRIAPIVNRVTFNPQAPR